MIRKFANFYRVICFGFEVSMHTRELAFVNYSEMALANNLQVFEHR